MVTSEREKWLHEATLRMVQPMSELAGLTIHPDKIRVGVGDIGSANAIGVCYPAEWSEDGVREITVHLRHKTASHRILGTLVHELIHAAGIRGHRKDFARAGRSLGLVGKPTSMGLDGDLTDPDFTLPEYAVEILTELGEYPAARLNIPNRGGAAAAHGRPKQTTRMLRRECNRCGLLLRLTAKWAPFAVRCPDDTCDGQLR